MSRSTAAALPFRAIAIVGCGLIGCSIAAALRKRGFPGQIIGCGRPGRNLSTAQACGYIDSAETDVAKLPGDVDLAVVCTPVDRIVEDVRQLASTCRSTMLITDAGSAKQTICAELRTLPPPAAFIGSHPIAGSEKQGCEHACADLFVDRVCVLTPDPQAPRAGVERLARFWESLGMTTVEMAADAHDRALAQTSHVPHAVAAALAATLDDENRALTAGGFHDTTRIASGDPDLWTAILMANAREAAAGLRTVAGHLETLRAAIEKGDARGVKDLLSLGKQRRDAIGATRPAPHADCE